MGYDQERRLAWHGEGVDKAMEKNGNVEENDGVKWRCLLQRGVRCVAGCGRAVHGQVRLVGVCAHCPERAQVQVVAVGLDRRKGSTP